MTTKIFSGLTVLALAAGGLALHGVQQKTRHPVGLRAREIRVSEGPVIKLISAKEAIVSWSTNLSTDTVLIYGTRDKSLNHSASAPWGGVNHVVRLTDLAPDTEYYYRVGKPSEQESEAMTELRHFKTPLAN